MNADTVALSFYAEACKEFVGILLEDAMDQRVVSTDLKLRHIVNKAVEVAVKNLKKIFLHNANFSSVELKIGIWCPYQASNIWMEKLTSNCPYAEALRNKMADVEMPALPENLFMNL